MQRVTILTNGKLTNIASTVLWGYHRTNMTGFNADNGVLEINGGGKKMNVYPIVQFNQEMKIRTDGISNVISTKAKDLLICEAYGNSKDKTSN